MKTPKEISKEIFYKPATNGKAAQSVKEGAELIESYAQYRVNNVLQEAAEKIETKIDNMQALSLNGYSMSEIDGLRYAQNIIESLQIKDQ